MRGSPRRRRRRARSRAASGRPATPRRQQTTRRSPARHRLPPLPHGAQSRRPPAARQAGTSCPAPRPTRAGRAPAACAHRCRRNASQLASALRGAAPRTCSCSSTASLRHRRRASAARARPTSSPPSACALPRPPRPAPRGTWCLPFAAPAGPEEAGAWPARSHASNAATMRRWSDCCPAARLPAPAATGSPHPWSSLRLGWCPVPAAGRPHVTWHGPLSTRMQGGPPRHTPAPQTVSLVRTD